MRWIFLVLLPLPLLGQPSADKGIRPVTVSTKRALIIGNGTYLYQDRIPQALHDADDMNETLKSLGFITTVRKDLTLSDLNREANSFVRTIQRNDLVFLYYSGHGGMVEGENFILPVNYERPSLPREVEQRAFRMSYLKKDLEGSGARVRVLIFDACRNNSLVGEKSGAGGGLAAMRGQPEGTIIAFASDDGQPARYDPRDRNSFYTKALRFELAQPGRHLKEALERTQLRVFEDTGNAQRPYLYGFLTGPVYLGTSPVVTHTCGDAWSMVKDTRDAASLEAFTQDFSECTSEVRLAKLRLTTLERRIDPPAVVTTGPKTNQKDGLEYMWIPPGTFQMGCSSGDNECGDTERPTHEVQISKGFFLGQTEVTQAAFQQVTGKNPSNFKGNNLPVEQVTWEEAHGYCSAVGGRLPTEAEWEYAARAGSAAARYGDLDSISWYDNNSGNKTHEIGKKSPNGFGLYDMLGNVWEWTADWFDEAYYAKSPKMDPQGPASGTRRSLRGGSWRGLRSTVRSSYRAGEDPGVRFYGHGFRCAW